MAKNLTELTARTATADSDLLHINSGGTDYKEQKVDFLEGCLHTTFATDTLLTTQVDNLSNGTWVGYCNASGHQTETGLPINRAVHVTVIKRSNYYIDIEIKGAGQNDNVWAISKNNGTWASSWTQRPTRAEMNRIYSDLASITAGSSVTLTVASNSRMILFATGGAAARCGAWNIFVSSTGGVFVSPIGTIGSYVSASSSGDNKIVVSNTTSGSGSAYLNAIVFTGSIS